MSTVKIQANEFPIHKVFSNDFVFNIPLYQRPYAWTTEQAEELLEDLLTCLGDSHEPIEEINPYFLGSIVLIKEDNKPDAEVVDGQQRLTTLTILLAVLRTLVQPEYVPFITGLIYEQASPFHGTQNRYRLNLAKRDVDFFKEYIQHKEGISKLKDLSNTTLSDSRKNIKANALFFLERLRHFSDDKLIIFTKIITLKCFLVIIFTPDFDSAYRIFSVLNSRGLDLSPTDILKADIIGAIPDEQKEKYTTKWENIEANLGRDSFKDIFSYIRMIYRKAKLSGTILKEIKEYVKPADNPQEFIDKILRPLADSYYNIQTKNYTSTHLAAEVNDLFGWLNKIDNSDWIPPAIKYLSDNHHNPNELLNFFTDLERLAAGLMIRRTNINERIGRYAKLLTAMEERTDLYAPESPLQLTPEEKSDVVKILDGDIYLIRKIRMYVLLRLNNALSNPKVSFHLSSISIEHVLPQNLPQNSEWEKWFSSQEEREKYQHRLGNLVLLSSGKNAEAQNYEFAEKKQKYFTTKTGVSPFALTTQVLTEQEWTPKIIDKRQKQLVDKLKEVWRL